MKPFRFIIGLSVIIAAGALIPVAGSLSLHFYHSERQWINLPFHAVVEAFGSFIALTLSGLLLMLRKRKSQYYYPIWIPAAFISMGVLDGFHAAVASGNTFVWLHSIAVLFGGVLISLVWVPEKAIGSAWTKQVPLITFIVSVLVASISLVSSDALPHMIKGEFFTPAAHFLNMAGGILFAIASAYFIRQYYLKKTWDEYLLAGFCLFLGTGGVLFNLAHTMWEAEWWWWHLLRFSGYLVAFMYIIILYLRNERELKLNIEELGRSNTEFAQFANIASHDLQEPLRMVASYVQLIERNYKGRLGADADEFIGYAVEGAMRMKTLINDMIEYSRINMRPDIFEKVDCEKVLKGAMDDLRTKIENNKAIITHDTLPVLSADDKQLYIVFQHLIDNAIKFRNKGYPSIHISADKRKGEWLFSVKDNGIGIEPQYFESIFMIFKRLHTIKEYSGTGIGLALCKRIVERHGGKIWVESELGKGTTFYFSIKNKGGT